MLRQQDIVRRGKWTLQRQKSFPKQEGGSLCVLHVLVLGHSVIKLTARLTDRSVKLSIKNVIDRAGRAAHDERAKGRFQKKFQVFFERDLSRIRGHCKTPYYSPSKFLVLDSRR